MLGVRHHYCLLQEWTPAVVRLLLETGKANANLEDIGGQTPLLLASKNGHEVVIRLLVEMAKSTFDSRDYAVGATGVRFENGHQPW